MSVFESKIGNPVLFIAEVGGNHEGDFEYAKKLVTLALESGADFVKLQLYTAGGIVSPVQDPDRHKHFQGFELNKEQYVELAQLCDSYRPGSFMASVWDDAMFDWYNDLVSMHKVGSGDVTNYPLIKRLVQTGKPLIISTGLSTMEEVNAVVAFVKSVDASYITEKKLALLQCTSSYPTPENEVNLNVIKTLADASDLPVGYSDHTEDTLAVETAVALGAQIIEKHFTDTREGKTFRDHKVSITRDELKALMLKLTRIQALKGNAQKAPTPSEISQKHTLSFRRSVYVKQALAKGDIIREDNITTLRPKAGVCASEFYAVLGKKVSKDLQPNEVITDACIEAS